MLKKAVSKAAGESKPEAYPLGYVEDFDELRTKLADFFSILLEESAFLEKLFVNDRGRVGGKLSPFLQQTFDVFPDQVRFEVDLIADLLEAQGGDLRSVRNNRDREPTICHLVDRQADAVNGDGPFQDTMSQNLQWRFDREQDGVSILLAATNRADTVYVTSHEMPAEPFVDLHRAFQIQWRAGGELPESGHRQRFRRDLNGKSLFGLAHHGQTGAVDADAVPDFEVAHHR